MSEVRPSGLFYLHLQTSGAPGAPVLDLRLTVYTPKKQITGLAEVTQATNPPLDVKSHVTGDYTYETVIGQGSKIRIDLQGWPELVWPVKGGIGPVVPENFYATLVLDTDYSEGEIHYGYRTGLTGAWHEVTQSVKAAALAKAA
ncbi:DUF1842 domain-containing protein [Agrobacterium larrymoorei]|uniref:DUF1842 domain-containing protein n=1 Tax=Agrobacterium larrymoorei TaxID=160699 RepID=A0A4D7DSY3_9HYPH|nr:DUF1842 domain-containing protein [Agrobacterium larrymoorei]QCI97349.1 DUF1842 domain-containing protein [Agrobacterium larrymoorei]QYA07217.1 DUF1842 domain-containing protein [Agrobacterium larrymoorei]WHA42044.1 DUF1842 domain-containing protein [Agrobacterium larrymoorei]